VRFSRGFGLPEPIPELMSMAIKVPNAYGPGATTTCSWRRPATPAAAPRVRLGRLALWTAAYSTVLPFRVGERTMVLGAVPREPAERRPGDLPELEAAAGGGDLAFDLRVATPLGPWRTVARLEVGRRLADEEEDALAFNSTATGGGIEPVG
jgi:hypothetical protein